MQRKWRKFRALSWSEKRLLMAAAFLFPWVELALRLRGYRWTRTLLSRFIPHTPVRDHLSPEVISQLVRRAAAASPYGVTCLRQSLILWWLLTRRGVICDIKIGTAHNADGFQAHAWVEWEGGGTNDRAEVLKRFRVLER
jgi:hypothetical protein